MKRFHSKLESLQRLHAHRTHISALELSHALRACERTTARIESLHREHRDTHEYSNWQHFDSMYWSYQYRKKLHLQISALNDTLRVEQQRVREQQEIYNACYIKRVVFEKLIVRQKRMHRKEQDKANEDYTDDIGRYLLIKNTARFHGTSKKNI